MRIKRRCLLCNEKIKNPRPRKKFCSSKCRMRHNALIRYYKIKDTDKYKAYRRKYFKKWLEDNHDKFNSTMRELMRKKAAIKQSQKV